MTPKTYLDAKIEYWHTHDTGNTLKEYLKLTDVEYEKWGMGQISDEVIESIVTGREWTDN